MISLRILPVSRPARGLLRLLPLIHRCLCFGRLVPRGQLVNEADAVPALARSGIALWRGGGCCSLICRRKPRQIECTQPQNFSTEWPLLCRLLCRFLLASSFQLLALPLAPAKSLLGQLQKAGALQRRAAEHARGHPALRNVGVPLPESLMGEDQVCLSWVSLQNFQKGSTETSHLAKHMSNATKGDIASPSVLLMAWGPKLWQGPFTYVYFDINMHIAHCYVYTSVFHQLLRSSKNSWGLRGRYKWPENECHLSDRRR